LTHAKAQSRKERFPVLATLRLCVSHAALPVR
jgi:hypothetical protein